MKYPTRLYQKIDGNPIIGFDQKTGKLITAELPYFIDHSSVSDSYRAISVIEATHVLETPNVSPRLPTVRDVDCLRESFCHLIKLNSFHHNAHRENVWATHLVDEIATLVPVFAPRRESWYNKLLIKVLQLTGTYNETMYYKFRSADFSYTEIENSVGGTCFIIKSVPFKEIE